MVGIPHSHHLPSRRCPPHGPADQGSPPADETGIANLFVPCDTFHAYKLLITTEPFLLAEGRLQISEGDQPTVDTTALAPLPDAEAGHAAGSHDFR